MSIKIIDNNKIYKLWQSTEDNQNSIDILITQKDQFKSKITNQKKSIYCFNQLTSWESEWINPQYTRENRSSSSTNLNNNFAYSTWDFQYAHIPEKQIACLKPIVIFHRTSNEQLELGSDYPNSTSVTYEVKPTKDSGFIDLNMRVGGYLLTDNSNIVQDLKMKCIIKYMSYLSLTEKYLQQNTPNIISYGWGYSG